MGWKRVRTILYNCKAVDIMVGTCMPWLQVDRYGALPLAAALVHIPGIIIIRMKAALFP